MAKYSGYTDRPTSSINEDLFNIEKYIQGLSSFILECNTPMTIAIQGDWGSGKTSFMNMIKETVQEKVVVSWFNTWRYSQFNMGDEISLSLIRQLINTLPGLDEKMSDSMKKIINGVAKVIKAGALVAAEVGGFGNVAEGVVKVVDSNASANADQIDATLSLGMLKEQFQECIRQVLVTSGKDRVVVFVDDLDRLNPAKAVELLEVLKLFLDCENCVFILAIDYQVVSQGISEKYGNTLDEEKGKAFFDKIIQVPFKMPVALYDMYKFINNMLEEIGFQYEMTNKNQTIDYYIKLIQASIGSNPRAIKRLFNAYLLLKKIYGVDSELDEVGQKLLFAILCAQLSFENLYNYIILNKCDVSNGDFLQKLKNQKSYLDENNGTSLYKELGIKNDDELRKICYFMEIFYKAIDHNEDGDLSEEETEKFINLLNLSSIISTNDLTENKDEKSWMIRRSNRRLVKQSVFFTLKKYKELNLKIYQSNQDRGDWKFQDVSASGTFSIQKNKVEFCFQLQTDFDTEFTKIIFRFDENNNPNKNDRGVFFDDLSGWAEANDFECDDNHCFSKTINTVKYDNEEGILNVLNNEVRSILDSLKALYKD
ncbi:KAP family P-loop NTPase fold protein [Acetobacterium malicum]|uniref:KAP family P-loop NTPase fold protein n=1 Tax=Acetobacterium malicum TaxID=52692 RepID=UPI00041364A4|nr:P-loop NTPase fold protein [Acetobacterium dehalogenans]